MGRDDVRLLWPVSAVRRAGGCCLAVALVAMLAMPQAANAENISLNLPPTVYSGTPELQSPQQQPQSQPQTRVLPAPTPAPPPPPRPAPSPPETTVLVDIPLPRPRPEGLPTVTPPSVPQETIAAPNTPSVQVLPLLPTSPAANTDTPTPASERPVPESDEQFEQIPSTTGLPEEIDIPIGDDEVSLWVAFPQQFRGVLFSSGVLELYSDQSARTGRNEKCTLAAVKEGPVHGGFVCRKSESGRFYVQIRGFDVLSIDLDTEQQSSYSITIPANNLRPSVQIVVLPRSLAEQEQVVAGFPRLSIEHIWPELIGGGADGFINAYFRSIDPDAGDVASICPASAPFTAESLLVDGVAIIHLACDFVFLDVSGAVAGLGDKLALDGCHESSEPDGICVFRPDQRPDLIGIDDWLATGAFDLADQTVVPGLMALDDLVRFTASLPLFSGEVSLRIGEFEEAYMVSAASLQTGAGVVCGIVLRNTTGEPLVLAGTALSAFECTRGRAETLRIELTGASGGASLFPANLVVERALSGSSADFAVSPFDAYRSLNLHMTAGDSRALPSFFLVRVYGDIIECLSASAPLVEQSVSGTRPVIQLGGQIIGNRRAAIQVQNGEQRITDCQALDLEALVTGVEESSLVASLNLEFIRPGGPYTVIVLSPTRRMADEGWRNIFQTVFRDMVTGWAEDAVPLPVDIFQITESRALRLIVAGEDYTDLPATGGSLSIQGRFDTVRYDATNPNPLDDINIIERNLADVDLKAALLIVDSSSEAFEPEEMGSLYHWLVNRNMTIQVISIGKCDMWVQLSKNIENKISCFDLESIAGLPDLERYGKIEELFGNSMVLERN